MTTRDTRMNENIKVGCNLPIFAPHCNEWSDITGCTKDDWCNHQFDYQEYLNGVKDIVS